MYMGLLVALLLRYCSNWPTAWFSSMSLFNYWLMLCTAVTLVRDTALNSPSVLFLLIHSWFLL